MNDMTMNGMKSLLMKGLHTKTICARMISMKSCPKRLPYKLSDEVADSLKTQP